MSTDQFQLLTSSIFNILLQDYEKKFTFIVNGQEFKTSIFFAELLSPLISRNLSIDPTIDKFYINTESQGNFQSILDLINFQSHNISENEKSFIFEILEFLDNDYIQIKMQENELNLNSAFDNISFHEKHKRYFNDIYTKEVDFISEHFYEIGRNDEEKLFNLSIDTIKFIISNSKLQLKTEGQLLNVINCLYSRDLQFSVLYEYVNFLNVEEDEISSFLSSIQIDDISRETWRHLSKRLKQRIHIKDDENEINRKRPLKYRKSFPYKNKVFEGIFNYIQKESKGNFEEEVTLTSSPIYSNDVPIHAVSFNQSGYFQTTNAENSFLRFDFKEHRVFPTNYTIKSYATERENHPKNWVIEGSNDGEHWVILDEEKNCPFLNGSNRIYTFSIQNENVQEFRYLQIRQNGENWVGHYHLLFNSIEFYGDYF